ncbi:DUF1499 domain-containing protein [Rhodohalobacter sp. SW132]|uniref:DUF1499 domain-containing protein n=1 Tax=Rhodohalobacter sp. SW132 TaxID=2293433 RepID=UPI000E23A3A1|nr:DUF1499 domain-containing protein [Rhodohalobacter sp. SW132]REL29071.1 DUF1499 domain-containing protein [Rhodohalobacter sp. SW132]
MKLSWIIAGLLALFLIILLNLVGPLKGSTNSDFSDELQPGNNPLPACPDSPNCVRISKKISSDPSSLFDILPQILGEMGAEKIDQASQTLQTDAVFRIPVFGFRDDFNVRIEAHKNGDSVLHISSRSRVGRGDLGVNRRRVNTFINSLDIFIQNS